MEKARPRNYGATHAQGGQRNLWWFVVALFVFLILVAIVFPLPTNGQQQPYQAQSQIISDDPGFIPGSPTNPIIIRDSRTGQEVGRMESLMIPQPNDAMTSPGSSTNPYIIDMYGQPNCPQCP